MFLTHAHTQSTCWKLSLHPPAYSNIVEPCERLEFMQNNIYFPSLSALCWVNLVEGKRNKHPENIYMIDIWKECLEMRFGSGRTNGQQLILELKNLWLRWLEKGKALEKQANAGNENSIKGYNFNGTQSRNDRIKLTSEINLWHHTWTQKRRK